LVVLVITGDERPEEDFSISFSNVSDFFLIFLDF